MMTVTTDNMLQGAAVYVVEANTTEDEEHSLVFSEAFDSRAEALAVLTYGRRLLPDYLWDMRYVTRPSVEYAIHKIDTHVESLENKNG
jgi:hypothetical protein